MECKFAVICKFCQPESKPELLTNVSNLVVTGARDLDRIERFRRTAAEIKEQREIARIEKAEAEKLKKEAVKLMAKAQENLLNSKGKKHTPKKVVGIIFPTNQEKSGKGKGTRHCKKCEFTCEGQGNLLRHFRKEHPKANFGKQGPADLQPANDKKAAHAFKVLQKRANKGKLTEEQTTIFDNLEPEIIGLPVSKWPDGYPGRVIKLYNDVVG